MSRADEESAILALLHEIADKERAETADGNTYWTAPQIKQIFTVRVTGEIIVQKNSSLTPLTLTIETNEGTQEELPVYLKQVQLQKNDYRDEQHLRRSEASYAVEFFFYEQVGRRLDVVHVPSLYALKRGVYDDGDDFFLLLEDYSKRLGQISGSEAFSIELIREPLKYLAQLHASTLGLDSELNSLPLASMGWATTQNTGHQSGGRGLPNASGDSLNGVWEIGGYWNLEKRHKDLETMEHEWSALLSNFPEELRLQEHDLLGRRLKRAAYALDRSLRSQPMVYYCLLHGDYKGANVFFDRSAAADSSSSEVTAGAIDWQWCGWGLGIQDLVYFLSTSADLAVLHEESQNGFYSKLYSSLLKKTLREVQHGRADGVDLAGAIDDRILQKQFRLATCDYTRFLIGSMWGKVSRESLEQLRLNRNVGMHKRNLGHLVWLAEQSDAYLAELEQVSPVHTLVARALSLSIQLSERAGQIAREVAHDKTLGQVNKAKTGSTDLDPQTKADRDSEQLIVEAFSKYLPEATVIGEEGYTATNSFDVPGLDSFLVAPWELDLGEELLRDEGDPRSNEITIWIDPLDGTREYVEGLRECVTVLIGIAVNGHAVAGVINQPFVGVEGRTLWGGQGVGVWVHEGSRWERARPLPMNRRGQERPSDADSGRSLIVATTRSHPGPKVEEGLNKMPVKEVLRVGGAGGKVALILEGKADAWIYPQKGTKRWDTCAGEALLRAVGGFVVSEHGNRYDYGSLHKESPQNIDGVMAGMEYDLDTFREAFSWEAQK